MVARSFSFLAAITVALSLMLNVSCSSSRVRVPASNNDNIYNPKRIKSLKMAADNGVLFIVNDHVFRDLELEEVDTKCRRQSDPDWSEKIFSYLEVLDQHPAFYKKIHVIEVRRGDSPKIDIQKDLDNLTYLSITYVRSSKIEKISDGTSLPCDANSAEYRNRDLTTVKLNWPEKNLIATVLSNLPERPTVERFNFDRQFLGFLAERNTILKFTQELGFEKTPDGRYALPEVLNRLGQELTKLQSDAPATANINYWMNEIARKSTQASSIQLFAIVKDMELSSGVRVETEGEFARKVLGHQDPTYIFLSYKIESGSYYTASIKDLESCLSSLTDVMAGGFNSRKPASEERNSFLRPGYSCRQNSETKN